MRAGPYPDRIVIRLIGQKALANRLFSFYVRLHAVQICSILLIRGVEIAILRYDLHLSEAL